jgi:hypothetical protein
LILPRHIQNNCRSFSLQKLQSISMASSSTSEDKVGMGIGGIWKEMAVAVF